ncbi:MAG TPA: hypothetical protein VEC06_19335 [Paucimonas sp.]|nr:hypothetical protein [Paucimonas sp.]
MATIIAGRFDEQDEVQAAVAALEQAGFVSEHICAFYTNPPGRHATFPVGGDRAESPGAEDSGKGSATGAAAGAAAGATAGMAAAPLMGPIGPVVGGLVGAHLGSLVGTLSQMDEAEETPPVRQSGMLVAVEVGGEQDEARALEVLRSHGAVDIERAEGTIADGDWRDFNPVSTPTLIDRPGPRHA